MVPPNRIAAEDPLHESRDAHDCAPGRIGPRAAVPSQCDHCASPGCLRATPYACFHDECVVGLSEKKPVRRVSLRSENAFRVGRMARFYPSGTGWKRPRPMGHPRGMISPMRTWYAVDVLAWHGSGRPLGEDGGAPQRLHIMCYQMDLQLMLWR